MPLSFGRALTNRGVPFPTYQAKLGAHFQQGHALSYLPGKVGRTLPTGVRPFPSNMQSWACPSHKGAPFLMKQAKLGMPFSQGAPFLIKQAKWACPSHKGMPFPIYQVVCQELRMDRGIAKPGPVCRTWKRLLSYFEFFPAHLFSKKETEWGLSHTQWRLFLACLARNHGTEGDV
jgi:hypothetical protein